ncbi:uncharacterized protein [Pyxicephalus adspersus]|uniref:uncharacterized protein isoform X1 n=1 Tax=Pyxicephalus adspersus TaxID=30357 RepID=UPI003B5A2394
MDSDFGPVIVNRYSDTTAIVFTEKECFICREADKQGQEELLNYCDCRDLVGHHQCLLTWIQKGSGNEDRQRCSACTAKYHLQEGTVWKVLLCQWRSLFTLIVTLASIIAIPLLIHYLNTLTDPPPDQLFKIVAVCSGIIAETLLAKYFMWYCKNQYIKARLSSFSIKARSVEEQGRVGLQSPMAQSSLTIVVNIAETEKQTAVTPKDTLCLKLSV